MAQEALNKFYNLDNLVELTIDIDENTWYDLKNAEPRGGWGYKGPRYDWCRANSVTIKTKDFRARKFENVGIIKKSFAGSKSETKPSFRLDFVRYQEDNDAGVEAEIEALIGTKTLVLNNSVQDSSFIRQPLGYEMFRKAGVPSLRCNIAKVKINDEKSRVYVNIEAFKKRFLENNFNGNTKGNAYEIELDQDIHDNTWRYQKMGTPSFEGYSKFNNEKDIRLLGNIITSGDWQTVQKAVDVPAFIKFFAMETLLKHWDGFTGKINNTFIYNDTVAVADPTPDNLKFKFIPSGIDQILQEQEQVTIRFGPHLAKLVACNNAEAFQAAIRQYAAGEVFSDSFTGSTIDRIGNVLKKASTSTSVDQAMRTVKEQIRRVRSEALSSAGPDKVLVVNIADIMAKTAMPLAPMSSVAETIARTAVPPASWSSVAEMIANGAVPSAPVS